MTFNQRFRIDESEAAWLGEYSPRIRSYHLRDPSIFVIQSPNPGVDFFIKKNNNKGLATVDIMMEKVGKFDSLIYSEACAVGTGRRRPANT